ncbi:hypothetical protein P22_3514 [Propionispora sp. 2/2-37]|uniref:ACT domain-containing protein n=1 Tax=Propionispora sp. 2/2-37 TaxID=1677858 RepID=UPI0006C5EBF6|nr:ACT domain-containing protein [Propionispora sp. 2/2-37]CUH97386.1 hypothetical protein P22_3514 [Propionispora sp. 2/2-37]
MLTMDVLPDKIGICKLDVNQEIPLWALQGEFFSITKTTEELSIVCSEENIPGAVLCERGWRALKLKGPFPFDLVGIVAQVSAAVARAGVGIFVISTYDTDYILVKAKDLDSAVEALRNDGHSIMA